MVRLMRKNIESVSSKHKVPEPIVFGKWTQEEENYATKMINQFEAGELSDCEEGATLRSYLAKKLNCAPMRISKKFSGLCIGKHIYISNDSPDKVIVKRDTDLFQRVSKKQKTSASGDESFVPVGRTVTATRSRPVRRSAAAKRYSYDTESESSYKGSSTSDSEDDETDSERVFTPIFTKETERRVYIKSEPVVKKEPAAEVEIKVERDAARGAVRDTVRGAARRGRPSKETKSKASVATTAKPRTTHFSPIVTYPLSCSQQSNSSSCSHYSEATSPSTPRLRLEQLDINEVYYSSYCSTPVNGDGNSIDECAEAEEWRDVLVCLFGHADSGSHPTGAAATAAAGVKKDYFHQG